MTDQAKKQKPYISPSQLGLYTKCGEAWRRRYVLGEKIPPGVAAHRGSAVHKGAEDNAKHKIKHHVDLPVHDVVDIAAAAFDEKVKADGVFLSPEEKSAGESIVVGKAKDDTIALASVMARESLPRYQPMEVEVEGRLSIPESTHDLLGRIDLIDEREFVLDYKTSARAKNQVDIDNDDQFTFYDLLYRAAKGKAPRGIIVENLVSTKIPKALTFSTARTLDDSQALVNKINRMIDGLNKGVFIPATSGAWNCSPRWCGYWATCPCVNNKRTIIS